MVKQCLAGCPLVRLSRPSVRTQSPPAAECSSLTAGLSLRVDQGPDACSLNRKATALAVDADAGVIADRRSLLCAGKRCLATGTQLRLRGEFGGHADHVVPVVAPEPQGRLVGIDQPWTVLLVQGAVVMGQDDRGCHHQFLCCQPGVAMRLNTQDAGHQVAAEGCAVAADKPARKGHIGLALPRCIGLQRRVLVHGSVNPHVSRSLILI